jgi:cytidylate kinase
MLSDTIANHLTVVFIQTGVQYRIAMVLQILHYLMLLMVNVKTLQISHQDLIQRIAMILQGRFISP